MSAKSTLYHLIELWISLTRELHHFASPADQERFGTRLGDLLIRAAVYLGTIEKRPMTPAKLATYIGLPRPTVVRRLRVLERKGVIEKSGRSWCTPAKLMLRREQQDFSAIIKLVRSANEKLQKH